MQEENIMIRLAHVTVSDLFIVSWFPKHAGV